MILYSHTLKDFEVLAEKVVQVTNEEQHIVWEGYGLRLHIPHNSLPEGVNQCHLKIKVALAENFEVPEDSTLVSAVYSLSHDFGDKELQHPFTLEMQHCANTSALNDLCVVRAIDVSSKFEIFTGGDFTCSGYGAVDLCHFSLFGIILESISLLCFPLKYCAALYYTGIMHRQFDFEVFIIQDLDTQEEVCNVIMVCDVIVCNVRISFQRLLKIRFVSVTAILCLGPPQRSSLGRMKSVWKFLKATVMGG